MRLIDFLRRQYALRHDLETGSSRQLEYSIHRFGEFLERPPTLADCTAETLSLFVAWRQRQISKHTGKPISARTARNDRDNLVVLAKDAAESGLAPRPDRVRRPKVHQKIPVAWTLAELQRLRKATESLDDPLYWKTLIDVAYDTGLRCSDVLQFDMQSLGERGAALIQHKTGRSHVVWLCDSTVAALRKLGGRYPLAWTRAKKQYYERWKRLRRAAGLTTGATQQLRRTAATYVEREQPGAATKFLGHRTPGLAAASYIDPRIAGDEPVAPPTEWRNERRPGKRLE